MNIQDIILFATEAVQHAAENLPEAAQSAAEAAHGDEADPGLLGTLGINWKLFIAQLVNFSIVLFVFWKWVVKPLGKALTDRQERIESGLKNAEYMKQEKKNFEEWKKSEMQKVRSEADQIIQSTTANAEKMKNETVAAAQAQAAKLIEQTKASIQQEKDQVLREAKQEIATLVVAASEKILRAKLDNKKDHELISETVKDIR
jgi:F-type H+-transporting ATPase subunit b